MKKFFQGLVVIVIAGLAIGGIVIMISILF